MYEMILEDTFIIYKYQSYIFQTRFKSECFLVYITIVVI